MFGYYFVHIKIPRFLFHFFRNPKQKRNYDYDLKPCVVMIMIIEE